VRFVAQWSDPRKHANLALDDMESLKSTLSVMLQLHQVHLVERSNHFAEENVQLRGSETGGRASVNWLTEADGPKSERPL
jgi:hypothetical protein